MTTHAPYGPNAGAPPAYPPRPPGSAGPPQPPASQSSVPPYGAPYARHGQLIVPFPEEMHNASRPSAPAWWPVVTWSAFLGLLSLVFGLAGLAFGLGSSIGIALCFVAVAAHIIGIASASRRANQARRGRNSPLPYWAAWGVTMAVLAMVGVGAVAVGVPMYLNYREGLVTKVVESDLQHGKKLQESTGVTVTSAHCEPVGSRDAAGSRLYDCALALADGRTGSLMLTADSDGEWAAVPKKK